jgi:hypothetical protein
MYNSGNSSKNVTGASVVDGTLENADYADNGLSGDKIDGGIISNFQSTGIDDRLPTGKVLTLSDTNTQLSGSITFNGDTAADNALDDYEEGTHTCTATPATGTISLGNNQTLQYVKIGNIVTVSGRLNVGSVSTPTGTIQFSLPFTSWTGSGRSGTTVGTVQLQSVDITSTPATMSFYLNQGTSTGSITSTIDNAPWSSDDITLSASDIIVLSITYRTA